jgi:hypothetical protein
MRPYLPRHRRHWFRFSLLLAGLAAIVFFSPAGQALAVDEPAVQRDFEGFVGDWMAKLAKVCEENGRALKLAASKQGFSGEYVCYGPENRFWIKKTDSEITPYLGFISYQEKLILKQGRTFQEVRLDPGRVTSEMPVTEIFRWTAGRWVY